MVEDSAANPRYRLLETIRQYGRDRLVRSGEIDALGSAHLALLSRIRPGGGDRASSDPSRRRGSTGSISSTTISSNAMDWALSDTSRSEDALRLATSLWWFWTKRSHFTEGEQRLNQALAAHATAGAAMEAPALIGLVHLTNFAGTGRSPAATSRERSPHREPPVTCGPRRMPSITSPWSRPRRARYTSARRWRARRESSLSPLHRRMRGSRSPWRREMIGYDALQANRLDEAGRWFDEVIALERRHGDTWSIGILLTDLAGLRVLEGRLLDEARACAKEAMSCLQALRNRRGIGWCLQTIAMLEAADGRAQRAAWLYRAGEAMLGEHRRRRPGHRDRGPGPLSCASAAGVGGGGIPGRRQRRARRFRGAADADGPGAFATA